MTENLGFKTCLIFALIVGSIILSLPHEQRPDVIRDDLARFKIHLGLDLRGGAEIRLQIPASEVRKVREEAAGGGVSYSLAQALADSLEVMQKRIDESNIVKDASIRRQGEDIILIQLPGVTPRELGEIKRLITQLGTLEFRIVATDEDDTPAFLGPLQKGKKIDQLRAERDAARASGNTALLAKTRSFKAKIGGREVNYAWVPLDDRAAGDFGNAKEALLKQGIEDKDRWTGEKLSKAVKDLHGQTLQPIINFEIRGATNRKRFGTFTADHIKRRMAIVYNGRIVSAPTIQSRIPGSGIITGMTDQEVNDLTKQLKSGSLRVQPKLVSSNEVGPSLGRYTIQNGKRATIVGFGLVIVFMVGYYLLAGAVASTALMLNLLFLYGSLVLFGGTLTLPGIAGIILTVGMAVDANIIIFERIREERAAGNALLQAIEVGYERALTAIVDANITTFITAAILYYFGSGAVKGFAVTLLIGILTSLFTALYVTKWLFGLCLRSGILSSELKMFNFVGTPDFPVTSWRRKAMFCSLIVVSSGMLLFQGTDDIYGIDLAGGTLTEMALQDESVTAQKVRDALPAEFKAEVQEVQLYDAASASATADRRTKKKYAVQARNLPLAYFVDDGRRDAIYQSVREYLAAQRGEGWVKAREQQTLSTDAIADELGSEFGELLRFMVVIRKGIELKMVDVAQTLAIADKIKSGQPEIALDPRAKIDDEQAKLVKKYLEESRREQVSPEFFRFTLAKEFDKSLVPEGIGLPTKRKDGNEGFEVEMAFEMAYTPEDVQRRLREVTRLVEPDNPKAGTESEFPRFDVEAIDAKDGKSTRYMLRVPERNAELYRVPARVSKIQSDEFLLSEPFPTSESIGGVVAKYQKRDAIKAVFFSLIAILLYITLRFQFIYGLAAITCLAHDVLFTLGAIALFGGKYFGPESLISVEINLPILAAFLTIIGYSLNDTIVVFDRIRENVNKPGRHAFEPTANTSINQTLSRTLITSVTTLIAVTTLFVLNFKKGGVIEGFSFALIIGVMIGTYSSVFIATPILVEYHNREQARVEAEKLAKAEAKKAKKA